MPDQVRHDEFGPFFCETNKVWQFQISRGRWLKGSQSDQKRNYSLSRKDAKAPRLFLF
jgi:hypothetical protein